MTYSDYETKTISNMHSYEVLRVTINSNKLLWSYELQWNTFIK